MRLRDRARRTRDESGFTMIEVMVAVLMLLVGVLGTVKLISGADASTNRTLAREGGTNLAREVIESARAVPYPKLLETTLEAELQNEPGLGDDSADGGWQIRRRGVTYTVSTSVCLVDDDNDGLGVHDAGAFCGAPGGTADINPDDYKRVTVEVAWPTVGGTARVRQTTVVSNPGTASGPGIKTFSMTSPSSSPITSPTVTSASFAVTTTVPAETVSWSVDGNQMGSASGSGTSWNFTWPISSLYDGDYLVSAQGYDQNGSPGAGKVLTIELNRFAPLAPTGFIGGWNGSIVEFEWLPNPEGDLEGYRVYRGTTLVCGLQQTTTCRDPSPLNQSSTTYSVVAVDRSPAGALREGASASETVVLGNQAPNPPTGLTATKDAFGNTVLDWAAPSPADPDAGDTIEFYRIYRDGNTIGDRYDRTGPGELSFIDNKVDGATHTYWVSAVDNHYAESTLVGPVTR